MLATAWRENQFAVVSVEDCQCGEQQARYGQSRWTNKREGQSPRPAALVQMAEEVGTNPPLTYPQRNWSQVVPVLCVPCDTCSIVERAASVSRVPISCNRTRRNVEAEWVMNGPKNQSATGQRETVRISPFGLCLVSPSTWWSSSNNGAVPPVGGSASHFSGQIQELDRYSSPGQRLSDTDRLPLGRDARCLWTSCTKRLARAWRRAKPAQTLRQVAAARRGTVYTAGEAKTKAGKA